MNVQNGPVLTYEPPKIETYTDEELLEKLGAAHTGYVNGGNILG
ncbi:hypothetical protein KsCSTR_16760 [Candidatus Kuenenia stuttgartiensis]|jgi:hypothetical protein|uniref:Uncharacterized protein n=1 Tax=Kuenenia stuttgartiensis TaxID=174633 RepID=A0A2C9CCR2_KUEST|nr:MULTISPECIES: hypothetical protein [Kuenenia]MCZ7622186.1 hypothetical protein [Candidatus Kuenenia sp.]QII11055.1 hypothetical protein KsCSTR_16760 [Candidatus Kuenenia stuttgartiensis]SOH03368.1 hypothetical protein KSMBR1_0857 [Candidatus Kuenenia stuttgartiensis]